MKGGEWRGVAQHCAPKESSPFTNNYRVHHTKSATERGIQDSFNHNTSAYMYIKSSFIRESHVHVAHNECCITVVISFTIQTVEIFDGQQRRRAF